MDDYDGEFWTLLFGISTPSPAILCLKKRESMTFLKSQIFSTLDSMPLNRRCAMYIDFKIVKQ